MKNLIDFTNFTALELTEIIDMGIAIKKSPLDYSTKLQDKKLYLLFEKTSTRTYLSFTTGIVELGGSYYCQNWADSNFSIGDVVTELKYVGSNVNIIMARLKKNYMTQIFNSNSPVSFINGCDNLFHPCQALADMMTVKEIFGTFNKKVLYVGAKNNVLNSLIQLTGKLGGCIYGITPVESKDNFGDDFYQPYLQMGSYVDIDTSSDSNELNKYMKEIDVFYTDTWVDMEFFDNPVYKDVKEKTIKKMLPYQLNSDFLQGCKEEAVVLHDMPIHIGYEIAQDIVDKNLNTILQQAENRKHVEKALMVKLLEE